MRKYRIFEAPDGRYKLGQWVADGSRDFWIPLWSELWFNSKHEAEQALARVVAARQWVYDEEGKAIE